MRRVPVKTDINPESGTSRTSHWIAQDESLRAGNSPAPTDRRRLPVNKDIVCRDLDEGVLLWDDGRKRCLYQKSRLA